MSEALKRLHERYRDIYSKDEVSKRLFDETARALEKGDCRRVKALGLVAEALSKARSRAIYEDSVYDQVYAKESRCRPLLPMAEEICEGLKEMGVNTTRVCPMIERKAEYEEIPNC